MRRRNGVLARCARRRLVAETIHGDIDDEFGGAEIRGDSVDLWAVA